ncbi:terminase large subunit domain-containing protein [Rhizobium lusitanum]|uniref:terminase large subunit domain-containing protein n=1 Tax=Rhizobium lusitanum TaxID=293958 RepID=UPI0025729D02|nr:terminase family protein [Rhizobium lusitanum]
MSGPLSKEEWARIRRLSTDAMQDVVDKVGLPKALLAYQGRVISLMESTAVEVLFVEKSRRIGLTWGFAAYAALKAAREKAAGGMDVMYISYAQDMTREFIDACAMWARAYSLAAMEAEEFLFDDKSPDGDKSIQAFRIRFASGFEIIALSSAPRTLRGKQGIVMIDEAAFVDNLAELLKAALAFLMWGGKVIVCSTHNGFENVFNQQIQDVHAGKLPYAHVKIDLDSALQDGLYERICFVTRKEWSPEAEAEWREKIIKFYAAGADEELFCIPSQSGGAYLSRALIDARMDPEIPVIRWTPPKGFVDWQKHVREAEAKAFCEEKLKPLLDKIERSWRSCLGQDFARSQDLSVIHPMLVTGNLMRRTPFILELRDVPFTTQEQILFYIIDRLPRFFHAALDAGGNGAYLAEATRQKLGPSLVSEIKFSQDWYMLNMPKLKDAFENGYIDLPRDDDTMGDYRLLQMTRGVAKIPENVHTIGADGHKRHGDSAIAGALAYFASNQDSGPIGGEPWARTRKRAARWLNSCRP